MTKIGIVYYVETSEKYEEAKKSTIKRLLEEHKDLESFLEETITEIEEVRAYHSK